MTIEQEQKRARELQYAKKLARTSLPNVDKTSIDYTTGVLTLTGKTQTSELTIIFNGPKTLKNIFRIENKSTGEFEQFEFCSRAMDHARYSIK